MMIRRCSFALLLWLFAVSANAGMTPLVRSLATEPTTMLDLGMLKVTDYFSQLFPQHLARSYFPAFNSRWVQTCYDWDAGQIVVIITVFCDNDTDAATLRVVADTFFRMTPPDQQRLGGFFTHCGWSDANPDSTADYSEIDKMTTVKMEVRSKKTDGSVTVVRARWNYAEHKLLFESE